MSFTDELAPGTLFCRFLKTVKPVNKWMALFNKFIACINYYTILFHITINTTRILQSSGLFQSLLAQVPLWASAVIDGTALENSWTPADLEAPLLAPPAPSRLTTTTLFLMKWLTDCLQNRQRVHKIWGINLLKSSQYFDKF